VVGFVAVGLAPLGDAPSGRCPQIRQPWSYLVATHETVSGILDAFAIVRHRASIEKQSNVGRLTADQVNLLRAALVFTSSGLDATCQSLLMNALPSLLSKGGSAQERYAAYLASQFKSSSTPEVFVNAAISLDPQAALVDAYIQEKVKSSFQGSGDLRERVKDTLGIPSKSLPVARFAALDGFFTARNDIVHRLDYEDPSGRGRKRYHRAPGDVTKTCDTVLSLLADVVHSTSELLKVR
jgi:hypothetical protein